uniref:Enoyl-CoA hydratase domain-containing protein 3, mitochondrial n=1 Tax=Parascaris univalens TaxID=6257 RepID=A0A915C5X5_PARUN
MLEEMAHCSSAPTLSLEGSSNTAIVAFGVMSTSLRRIRNSASPLLKCIRMLSESGSSELVKREALSDGTIVRLVLNSPKKRNALSLAMIEALHKQLRGAESSDKARVIIVAAEGSVFSSGHDLKQLQSNEGLEKHKTMFESYNAVLSHIQNMSLPVIAEVNGIAAAAGCQLVATCDIVIAGKSSKFSTPGAKVGLFCSTPGIALARAVPRKLALDMLMTADFITAEQAMRAGLVSRLVDDDKVHEETIKVAEKIASMSRAVIALGKNFFYTQVQLPVVDAYRMGARIMVDNLRLADAQEGIAAFIDKRTPRWTHTDKKIH